MLFYLLLVITSSTIVLTTSSKDTDLVVNTVAALQKSAEFFKNKVDKVNLDCIFGLRAAEGRWYLENVTQSPIFLRKVFLYAKKNLQNKLANMQCFEIWEILRNTLLF